MFSTALSRLLWTRDQTRTNVQTGLVVGLCKVATVAYESITQGDGHMTIRRKCNAAMAAVAAVIFGLGAWGGAPDEARAAKDTLVIAIPGLPQGVDLDRHIGPQTWTMGAQLFALGMEWEYGPYPYSTGASVSALTAALGCSPTSCAPAWSTPSATRCRAWWKSTRPAFHSGPKTILPPEGKDAATTARCSSSAPSNSGTETSPGRLRLAEISSYGAADLGHFVETAADPDAIAKTDGWSGYAAVPADRHNVHVVGKTAAHLVLPWIHQVFSNLKGWARGVYHGLRRKHLQAYLDEFVFRFNRRKNPPRCFPLALPHRHQCRNPLPTAC